MRKLYNGLHVSVSQRKQNKLISHPRSTNFLFEYDIVLQKNTKGR